ncbi:MAG: four helix bundle protein [Thermodesulfovibrionales bacterium]
MANYKNLIVWQKAHSLALIIYKITEQFPRHEQYALTSQIRKAALSIPTNIVEGYNRKSKREFIHFIDISLGSLAEVEYLLEFSVDLGYIEKSQLDKIQPLIDEIGKLLWSLQKSKLQPSALADLI